MVCDRRSFKPGDVNLAAPSQRESGEAISAELESATKARKGGEEMRAASKGAEPAGGEIALSARRHVKVHTMTHANVENLKFGT